MVEDKKVEYKNIFDRMYNEHLDRYYQIAKKKYEYLRQHSQRVEKRLEQDKELRAEAKECQLQLTDPHYPGQQAFLNRLVNKMQAALKKINAHAATRESLSIESARLGFAIETIEELRDRPIKIIECLNNLETEIERRQKGRNMYG